ncbi:hypothetical protein KCV01_g12622, partial [Aureobasidium melanogenum]
MDARWPAEREGEDITVEGRIVDLPRRRGTDIVFGFRPDARQASGERLRGDIRVTWYRTKLVAPRACEHWRLTLRLRRPRGGVNPGGADSERSALQRNTIAVGYVREAPGNRRLSAPVCVDGWREALAAAMDRAIGARASRMLKALAIGDTRGLDATDWDVARATGTSHLIAISGFHVGVAAGGGVLLARCDGGTMRGRRLRRAGGPGTADRPQPAHGLRDRHGWRRAPSGAGLSPARVGRAGDARVRSAGDAVRRILVVVRRGGLPDAVRFRSRRRLAFARARDVAGASGDERGLVAPVAMVFRQRVAGGVSGESPRRAGGEFRRGTAGLAGLPAGALALACHGAVDVRGMGDEPARPAARRDVRMARRPLGRRGGRHRSRATGDARCGMAVRAARHALARLWPAAVPAVGDASPGRSVAGRFSRLGARRGAGTGGDRPHAGAYARLRRRPLVSGRRRGAGGGAALAGRVGHHAGGHPRREPWR